jgi:hypothetical protein
MHVMTPRESWTDERLDDLKSEMNGRFDKLDARFDKLEARFDKLIFILLAAAVTIIAALIGFSSAILVAVL